MRLGALADGLFAVPAAADRDIRGLCADSRRINDGDAFLAVPGLSAHGLAYLNAGQAAKAAVVLFEPPAPDGCELPPNALAVPGLKRLQATLADRFYGAPSKAMTVVGVTGTNGKTSTVQLIAQAFTLLGRVAGTIGTLGTGLYGRLQAGERTTPDVIAVHRALGAMRDDGATLVAMEVSSHALDQGRVAEVAFGTAVFSNLTQDHLDYHGTMAAYFEAKAKLFAWPGLRHAVINIDDAYGRELTGRLPSGLVVIRTSSTGKPGADLRADDVRLAWTACASVCAKPVPRPRSRRRCSAVSTSTTCWRWPACCAPRAWPWPRSPRCWAGWIRSAAA